MSTATVQLSADAAHGLVARALTANRTAPAIAEAVATALVRAEVDGQRGHGLARGGAYARQARSGKVDGFAEPALRRPRQGLVVVDAKLGFAFPALALARSDLAGLAKSQGIAAAAITHSHHAGVLGHQVEALAELGLVALMVANTPKAMAPWGGATPVFGTNPIAFAAPRIDGPPLVIDLSLSVAARGKVMAAAKTGADIPPGWALDAEGQPTVDPARALEGSMLPAGGAKGAALALMVEVLAGALAGPHFSYEAADFFSAEGPAPALGQLLIALDPQATNAATGEAGGRNPLGRIAALLQHIEGEAGARLPGSRRLEAREAAGRDGLQVPRPLVDDLRALAGDPPG